MATFKSVNPKNGKLVKTFDLITNNQMFEQLEQAHKAYKYMRNQGSDGIQERCEKFLKLKQIMHDRKLKLAETITNEMGKPIKESIAEVEKSMTLIDYYVKNTTHFIQDEKLQTRFPEAYVKHQPLAIMPWNFPMWLPFKIGLPALMLGNPILLKHAANVPQCAQNLDDIFQDAQNIYPKQFFRGFDNGEYKNIFIDHDQSTELISDSRLACVKFVGSTDGGKKVAEVCGKFMKRAVFELGGSDAFIVFDDADIDLAVQKAIIARLHTSGQACNNAKRFIIQEKVYDQFVTKLKEALDKHIKIGDPSDYNTTIGPLCQERARDNLTQQVQKSIEGGAKIIYGNLNFQHSDPNLKDGYFFHPLVLENISKQQPAYCEELFGPVFSLFKFKDGYEAIELANDIRYGLSASIFSQDIARAQRKAAMLEVGNVFINEGVTSDPAIPGGGVKDSGFGRECYKDGLLETANRKAIIIGKL